MNLLCDEALAFIIAWTPYRESSMDSVKEYQVSEAHEWEPSSAILRAWSQPFPSSFIFGKSFSKDLSRNSRQTANQGRVMTMGALRHPSAREAMTKEGSSKTNSNQEKVDSRSRWRFRLLMGSCTCLHFKESPLTRKDVLWGWGMCHTHKQVLTLSTRGKVYFTYLRIHRWSKAGRARRSRACGKQWCSVLFLPGARILKPHLRDPLAETS